MRFSYDPRYNIAYIRFHGKGGEVESIRISDELIVDMAPDGIFYGIELLNANEQLHVRTWVGSWFSMRLLVRKWNFLSRLAEETNLESILAL